MFKVFLITLLLNSNGYDKGNEVAVGEVTDFYPASVTIPYTLENSEAMQACRALARQKGYTEFTPRGYMGIAFVCEARWNQK